MRVSHFLHHCAAQHKQGFEVFLARKTVYLKTPIDMSVKRVYLDNSATTRVEDEVARAMLPYFTEVYGNASSTHQYGQQAKQAIEDSRGQVALLLNADKTEITFLSGGTESDNLAIKGVAEAYKEKCRHIITSQIEHPAVLAACGRLEKDGWRVTYLPVYREGVVHVEDVREALTDETALITVMHANNEIGTIQPLKEIAALIKERRDAGQKSLYLHTDAVQSVGKIPVDVKELGVDLLTLTAHKIYGPKGVGVLYVRRGVRLASQMHGGHHERDRRVPNIAKINFDHVEGEGLQISLDLKGVAVSTGSACASGSTEPSHVLKAIGLPRDSGYGSLRFSFGKYNTREDVDYTLEILQAVVEKLRRLSPAVRKKQPANTEM